MKRVMLRPNSLIYQEKIFSSNLPLSIVRLKKIPLGIIAVVAMAVLTGCQNPYKAPVARACTDIIPQYETYVKNDASLSMTDKAVRLDRAATFRAVSERINN